MSLPPVQIVSSVGTENSRCCATCAFVSHEQMQGQIVRQLVCKRNPPSVSMVFIPPGARGIGEPGGLMGHTIWPIMQPHQWCHSFQPAAGRATETQNDTLNSGDRPLEVGDES